MAAFEIEVSIECTECGSALTGSSRVDRYGRATIVVDPCDKCLTAANTEGYKEAEFDMKERQ